MKTQSSHLAAFVPPASAEGSLSSTPPSSGSNAPLAESFVDVIAQILGEGSKSPAKTTAQSDETAASTQKPAATSPETLKTSAPAALNVQAALTAAKEVKNSKLIPRKSAGKKTDSNTGAKPASASEGAEDEIETPPTAARFIPGPETAEQLFRRVNSSSDSSSETSPKKSDNSSKTAPTTTTSQPATTSGSDNQLALSNLLAGLAGIQVSGPVLTLIREVDFLLSDKDGKGRKPASVSADSDARTTMDAKSATEKDSGDVNPDQDGKQSGTSNNSASETALKAEPAKTGKESPAQVSPSTAKSALGKSVPVSAQTGFAGSNLPDSASGRVAIDPSLMTVTEASASTASASGTRGALSSQRMNSKSEKDEIAGQVVQTAQETPGKASPLPRTASGPVDIAAFGASSAKEATSSSNLSASLPVSTTAIAADVSKSATTVLPGNHGAMQAERLGNLVQQQVTMIRQSGATNLAVSVKLDPHTEFSLQVTNHNGQIEASLRLERGTLNGLGGHWQDLQESLAKQNVQLLPLENKGGSRNTSANPNGDFSPSFNRSSQNSQGQTRNGDTSRESVVVPEIEPRSATAKTQTRTTPAKGWESWA